MDEERETAPELKRRDFVTTCLAFMTVATVGFSLWACGDDLTFPGQIPPTRTNTPTQTGTPDDEEEEDDEV